jgi:hypothetical protein
MYTCGAKVMRFQGAVGSFDQRTYLLRTEPAYGELGYGALLDRYSSSLINAYFVGFALPGYTERPDFNLVRYALNLQKIISTMNTKEG